MGTDLGPSDKWQGLLPRRRRSSQFSSGGICKRRSGQLMRCGTVTHWIWRLTCFVSTARERLRPPSNALPNIAEHVAE